MKKISLKSFCLALAVMGVTALSPVSVFASNSNAADTAAAFMKEHTIETENSISTVVLMYPRNHNELQNSLGLKIGIFSLRAAPLAASID